MADMQKTTFLHYDEPDAIINMSLHFSNELIDWSRLIINNEYFENGSK